MKGLSLPALLCFALFYISKCNSSTSKNIRGSSWSTNNDNVESCLTSVDCSMNGECIRSVNTSDPQVPGACQCFGGWKGSRCNQLDLLPVDKAQRGLQLPDNVSTWGGSVIERNGIWHMFASQMVQGCGLEYWTSNSQVIRAVSDSPNGPYRFQEVVLPVFAHEPNVVEAPTGKVVLFVAALAGVNPVDCTNKELSFKTKPLLKERPMDTYMLWAPGPEGPWSEPVAVFNSTRWNRDFFARANRTVICDSNLNGIILEDDSFLGLWRRCETPDLLTIPHLLTATAWRNASTYEPHTDPILVLGGSGTEDPSNVWTTTTSDMGRAYHVLFHDEQATRCMLPTGCSGNGRHAFSLDGKSWRYGSGDAYTRQVLFSDGVNVTATGARGRPHVLLDDSNNLIALSTGFQPKQESGYVWTLIQPVGRSTRKEGRIHQAKLIS